jgi:hypothetical protein
MPSPNNADVFGRQADEVRQIFGDLEIVEAKTDFVVYVTAEEQERSVRGNPNKCMFSNACKRAFGSKGVLFYPTVAYVDMIDPADASQRLVMRFKLPSETREKLEAFDRGDMDGAREATFVLKAVPKSQQLAYMAKKKRDQSRRKLIQQTFEDAEQEAEEQEKRKASAAKGRQTRRDKTLMGVRSGSGKVHTRNGDDEDVH